MVAGSRDRYLNDVPAFALLASTARWLRLRLCLALLAGIAQGATYSVPGVPTSQWPSVARRGAIAACNEHLPRERVVAH